MIGESLFIACQVAEEYLGESGGDAEQIIDRTLQTGQIGTDEAAGDLRSTLDVDAIVEITSYAQYARFGERLRALGFTWDQLGIRAKERRCAGGSISGHFGM